MTDLSEMIKAQLEAIQSATRAGHQAGYNAGYNDGYAAAIIEARTIFASVMQGAKPAESAERAPS